MRVAVVHDWLYIFGGAERVLSGILRCLPGADLFTLFDILPPADRKLIGYHESHTSFLQRMPGIAKRHRLYLPLMPLAIEQLDLSGYDLVISSSYAVAKGVITGPDQLHLAYVHSPMRYAWDLQHQYLAESNLTHGIKSALARVLLHRMRIWDTRTAHGVDTYMANSQYVARRVQKSYGRLATVIYPPVIVPATAPAERTEEDFFFTASRLVAYKNVRAVVEAFRELPAEKLVVAGSGPDLDHLKSIAGPNVEFLGFVPERELRRLMRVCRAFVFAAEEDFGIAPVEAQAEGTAVIALGRGGALETIVSDGPNPTGLLFDKPTPTAIADAIRAFILQSEKYRPASCHANALRFSASVFHSRFGAFVDDQLSMFRTRLTNGRSGPDAARHGAAVPYRSTVTEPV